MSKTFIGVAVCREFESDFASGRRNVRRLSVTPCTLCDCAFLCHCVHCSFQSLCSPRYIFLNVNEIILWSFLCHRVLYTVHSSLRNSFSTANKIIMLWSFLCYHECDVILWFSVPPCTLLIPVIMQSQKQFLSGKWNYIVEFSWPPFT